MAIIIKMWSLYKTLMILGFTSYVLMETCPAEEDINPCYCSEIKSGDILLGCRKSSFEQMLELETIKSVISSLSGKNPVHFILGNLRKGILPSNFFASIGIKSLKFDKCSLNSLKKDDQPWLLGLENYLEELRIEYDFDTEGRDPVKLSFDHLRKLKVISLLHNSITQLEDDWFSNGPSSLERLLIDSNNIKTIGRNAFAQLNNLKELSLVGNRFGHITRSMFPSHADRLKVLNLRNNALTELPEDLFSTMPSLMTVNLDDNRFVTLEERTWSSIWSQLWTVSLDGNNIYCDDRLNWISRSKERPKVKGSCRAPKVFEGKDLEEFFENHI